MRNVRVLADGDIERTGVVLPGSVCVVDGQMTAESNIEFQTSWDHVAFTAQVFKAIMDWNGAEAAPAS